MLNRLSFRLPALVLAVALAGACHSRGSRSDTRLFTLKDPGGDDHGDGELRYPLRPDMTRGDLDLLEVAAFDQEGGTTRFEVTFARPIARPTHSRTLDIGGGTLADLARHGFYAFNVDVYVDTDRVPDSGLTESAPGRGLVLDSRFAWDRVILLMPRPYEARELLRKHWRELALKDYQQKHGPVGERKEGELREEAEQAMDARVFFPTRIKVSGSRISFEVPNSFLGGPARPEWGYAVAVTGASVERRVSLGGLFGGNDVPAQGLMSLKIVPGVSNEHFGGGRRGDPGQSPVVDLLVPPGVAQEEVLGPSKALWPAVIPARSAEVAPAPAPPEEGPASPPGAPASEAGGPPEVGGTGEATPSP